MESENFENTEQNTINSTISKAEARRRRILENGNNRLGKITGRVHNEGIKLIVKKILKCQEKKHDMKHFYFKKYQKLKQSKQMEYIQIQNLNETSLKHQVV